MVSNAIIYDCGGFVPISWLLAMNLTEKNKENLIPYN